MLMFRRLCLGAVLGLASLVAHQAQAGVIVYDANAALLAHEASPLESDPNFSNFTAGYAIDLNPASFTAFSTSQHTNNWFNSSSRLQGWFRNNNVIVPAVIINTSASAVSSGSVGPIDPGQILLHGGGLGNNGFTPPIYNAVLRFTASLSGEYIISGDWESLDSGTTRNYILKNGVALYNSVANNASFNLKTTLNAGDTIDFLVNDFNGISNDSTGLRTTLTLVPEPSAFAVFGLGALGCAWLTGRRRVA